ncbi:MAG: amidase domain-containing protein [Clostridiales bacterium]|jgi:hypothetical protein|nr:amidase domain-containing protein [Clostridiales bacterium]
MLVSVPYNRDAVVEYAAKWALSRNPRYANFDGMGDDCTNFVSQCIYAGCRVMNYTPIYGWYYINLNNRSPAWSSVQYLYKFLINNKEVGPYCVETDREHIQKGDIIQLRDSSGTYYHSLVVMSNNNGNILISAHTYDALNRPLDSYVGADGMRFLHIVGARKWV